VFKDFNQLKDEVKFGERADAPPTLTKIPKIAQKVAIHCLHTSF
jgi:hypothetical protein